MAIPRGKEIKIMKILKKIAKIIGEALSTLVSISTLANEKIPVPVGKWNGFF